MLLCFACVVACVVDWWDVFVVGGSFFLFFFLFLLLLLFCSPIFVKRVFSEELLGLMLGLFLFMPMRAAGTYVEADVFFEGSFGVDLYWGCWGFCWICQGWC